MAVAPVCEELHSLAREREKDGPAYGLQSPTALSNGSAAPSIKEEEELVEKDIRDRFKKMCEGYFDNVAKKLVIEHNVSRISIFHLRALVDRVNSAYKNKTVRIMKHTFGQERYLRIDNKRTRR